MSEKYWRNLFKATRINLNDIIERDQKLGALETHETRKKLIGTLGRLYVRYLRITNDLRAVLENTQDPVMEKQVQRVLDVTLARCLQIKEDLSKVEADHFNYLIDILLEEVITPFDIRLTIPRSYKEDREEKLQQLRTLIEETKIQLEEQKVETEEVEEEGPPRIRYSMINNLMQAVARASVQTRNTTSGSEDTGIKYVDVVEQQRKEYMKNVAARKIIKYIVKYYKRRKMWQNLGLEAIPIDPEAQEKDEELRQKKLKRREAKRKALEERHNEIRERFENRYGGRMKEDIRDEIREWYTAFYEHTNEFPNLPDDIPMFTFGKTLGLPKLPPSLLEEKFPPEVTEWPKTDTCLQLAEAPQFAGSALVQAGCYITPEKYLECKEALLKLKGKKGKIKPKKKPAAKKPAKKSKKDVSFEYKISNSDCIPTLRKIEESIKLGEIKMKPAGSDSESEDEIDIRGDVLREMNLELRKSIDADMREEIIALQMSTKKKKKKKKKKGKKGKRKKKKKKELPPSTPEMWTELIRTGILCPTQSAKLSEYRGEGRLLPPPTPNCPADIIDQCITYCILPMGSATVHRLAPLTRSVCLVGPQHSSKKYLAQCIISESGAVLFDLSPDHLAEHYTTKQELNELLKSLTTMAKEVQPSIIFINNVEKIFYKKVPKEDRHLKAKRFVKLLKKFVKSIKNDQQVMVLATCSRPWLAKKGPLVKMFDKILPVPSTNYGTYSLEWEKFFDEASIPVLHTAFAKVAAEVDPNMRKNLLTVADKVEQNQVDRREPGAGLAEILIACKLPPKEVKENKKMTKFLSKIPLEKKKKLFEKIELEQAEKGKRKRQR